jgi:hypothetical protein
MTLLTSHTELSIVGIVTAVATYAVAANGRCIFTFRSCLLVATFAGNFAVRALQTVFSLGIVVEAPDGPGSGVVASVAAHTKFL